MTHFSPSSDAVVRHAVEQFLAGATAPEVPAEASFGTQRSRYQLLNGILVSASDDSLRGAALVGWLIESPSGRQVVTTWRTNARAVLVDPNHERHIVVTSPTRYFEAEIPIPADNGQVIEGSAHDGSPHHAGSTPYQGHLTPEFPSQSSSNEPRPALQRPSAPPPPRASPPFLASAPALELDSPRSTPRPLPPPNPPPFRKDAVLPASQVALPPVPPIRPSSPPSPMASSDGSAHDTHSRRGLLSDRGTPPGPPSSHPFLLTRQDS